LQDKAQTLFVDGFEEIFKYNPKLENEIKNVPGLMTKLFLHMHKKKIKKRKVTFVVE